MSAPGIASDVPEPTVISAPFWDGTRRQELVLQWCTRCDRGVHYPRLLCPHCGADGLTWRRMSGTATVYAHAVHRPPDAPAYCVALVDLAEGVRLLTHLVGTDADEVRVGQPVQVRWCPLPDGRHLPVFEPESTVTEKESR